MKILFENLTKKLDEVISSNVGIQSVFEGLKSKDAENGKMIEESLNPTIEQCSSRISKWVEQHKGKFLRAKRLTTKMVLALENLQNTLEATADEIKVKLSPFISYSETMARRKADLQAFAAETEQKLVAGLLDDIERLFDEKRKRLCNKIDIEFGAKERLTDTFLKPLGKGIDWAMEKTGLKVTKDDKWHQTWLEQAIEAEFGKEILEKELKGIFKKAQDNFQKAWEKKALESPPDLKVTESLMGSGKDKSISLPLNLDISTAFLTSGAATSIATVAGLAAGWHTLEYALATVLPPAAVITLLSTALAFLFTAESVKENRKDQVKRLIETYYGKLLTSLLYLKRIKREEKLIKSNNGIKIKIKKEKTEYSSLYELIHNASINCVNNIIEKWEREISGNLTSEDYHKLSLEISKYLTKVNTAIEYIKNTLKSLREAEG